MSVAGTVGYKSVRLVGGMLAGVVAGAVFTRIWHAVRGGDEAPDPAELNRDVGDVLVAAVLQAAIFGLVKAAMDRIVAKGYRRVSGHAPDL